MSTSSTIDQRLIPTIQYVTPTTGNTVNANDAGNHTLIINPAGSLLALTVALNGSPADGDVLKICSSQVVTTFSMTGGTIVGALTTLAVATFAAYVYNATASKWFRVG
jgi:hypothetical protein